MSKNFKAVIFGGSGYGGSELLRLLLFHDQVEIVAATANEHAGKLVSEVHRNLLGLTELVFSPTGVGLEKAADADVVFCALPHGEALRIVPQLPLKVKVIDLSGDFRIDDKAAFEKYYKLQHTADELQKQFVYGLTEINRSSITSARRVANPGCFATATLLALAPLAAGGLIAGKIIADVKTGSSGSGAKPAENTHHPQRANSFYAYKPFTHQHLPEISQELSKIGSPGTDLVFMTHSIPVSRGIFASCYLETTDEMGAYAIADTYKTFYTNSFFVRLREGSPDINWVKHTNFCDISVASSGRNVAVFAAIDNLVKGAAGQAVQNMNLMLGLNETIGLKSSGSNP